MQPRALKLPKLTAAQSQFLAHVAIVFLVAFGGQLSGSLTGAYSMPALLAVLTSAAAAGVTATIHYLLGLVPAPATTGVYGVPLVVKAKLSQVAVSVVATFLSIFGASLVAGATGVTSLPDVTDLIVAAISAAVAGAVQYAVGLIPVPSVPTNRPAGLRGRLPAKRVDLPFWHHIQPTSTALPSAYDSSHGFSDWLMLGNGPDPTLTINGGKPVGDCFWAALYHGLMTKALVQQPDGSWAFQAGFSVPTANEVVGYYLGFEQGLAPGQSATSGPDNGTVLADGLAWCQKAGVIKRYGPVDHTDRDAVHQAVIDHKGVILGVNLDADAEAEFEQGQPWRELHDPTVGGHAIYQVAFDPQWDTDITWAEDQRTSLAWDADQVEEAWWFDAPWEESAGAETMDAKLAALQS